MVEQKAQIAKRAIQSKVSEEVDKRFFLDPERSISIQSCAMPSDRIKREPSARRVLKRNKNKQKFYQWQVLDGQSSEKREYVPMNISVVDS